MKNNIKILNKQIIAGLLACSMGFTLSGCAKKEEPAYTNEKSQIEKELEEEFEYQRQLELAEEEYNVDYREANKVQEQIPVQPVQPIQEEPIEIQEEQIIEEPVEIDENNNEINNVVEVKSDYNVNLVVTNIPENARIILNDGNVISLNSFPKIDEYTYHIPSNDFTIAFDMNNGTLSYPINAENNSTVFISSGINENNEVQFNIEKSRNMSYEELKEKLLTSQINLGNITNNNGLPQNIVEKTNKTYIGPTEVYNRKAITINNVLINEELKEYDNIKYYSPLIRGNGINNIELIDNETVILSYNQEYINDYAVLGNMEQNINDFYNRVNETQKVNYFTSDTTNLVALIDENTKINEHIEKNYKGNNLKLKYSYNIDGNVLVEFGHNDYDNNYYSIDPIGIIKTNEIEYINDNTNSDLENNYYDNTSNELENNNYDNYESQDIYTNVDTYDNTYNEEYNNSYDEYNVDIPVEQNIYEYEEDYTYTR